MNIVVTGANGFIGSFLVEALVGQGYRVRCFVLRGEPVDALHGLPVEIVYGDVCSRETLGDAVKDVDYVYHLAGIKTVWDEQTYFRVNFQGTRNVLEAARQASARLKRFVYVSSQAAAGPSWDGHPLTEEEACHPVTAYGRSKRAAETYLLSQAQQVPITIVRPTLVYGPRNLETAMLYTMVRWRLLPLIRREQYLNLIHVRDAVRGILLAAQHEQACGQIYFITSEQAYTWREIGQRAFHLSRTRGIVLPVPWVGVKVAAGVIKSYRRFRGQPVHLIDDKVRELSQRYWVCSGQKARRELGFEPQISLDDGIRETLQWFEERRR
ncbi:MAG: NAD-dependent epimerase/dehydratase family protein [Acidobacteriota bacterium]|nr:NAD-dependent epimerase/dehydratase family protein [Blastocatellia bacterium]MDW8240014.1 NAD-dependent epimerase/dehydratase family protein [Acidobacteriota bacterium]